MQKNKQSERQNKMKLRMTYVRPAQPRIQSAWVDTDESHVEAFKHTYMEHGFKMTQTNKHRFMLSHVDLGIRILDLKE